MKHILHVEVIKSYSEPSPTDGSHRLWFRVLLTNPNQKTDSGESLSCTLDVPSYVFCDKVRLVRYINATYRGSKVRLYGLHLSKDASIGFWLQLLQSWMDWTHLKDWSELHSSWYHRAIAGLPLTLVNGQVVVDYAMTKAQ